MNSEVSKVKKTRLTGEQKLAKEMAELAAQQKKVADLKKALETKNAAIVQSKKLKLANLAADAGILDLPDSILAGAFKRLAQEHGIAQGGNHA